MVALLFYCFEFLRELTRVSIVQTLYICTLGDTEVCTCTFVPVPYLREYRPVEPRRNVPEKNWLSFTLSSTEQELIISK